jgi:hypothetical protein
MIAQIGWGGDRGGNGGGDRDGDRWGLGQVEFISFGWSLLKMDHRLQSSNGACQLGDGLGRGAVWV